MRSDEHLLTVEEVAEFLRLSPNTVRIWCSQGKIPYRKVGERAVRFWLPEILEWTKKRGQDETGTPGL